MVARILLFCGALLAASGNQQAWAIFDNYGLDPAYCNQPTVRQTVVYVDDMMMVAGQTEWAQKLDIKLQATLTPGERVSVVRLSPNSGQSHEYWSGCWPGIGASVRAQEQSGGMLEAVGRLFTESPETRLSEQRKFFRRDLGAALTRIYTDVKHPNPARIDSDSPPQKQLLRALASDDGRFSNSQTTIRAIIYSDFAEASDLGSAFKPLPQPPVSYGQKLGSYLHRGVFYGFGEGEDVADDPAFGETARAFWGAALRSMQGTVIGIGADLNVPNILPVAAYDYAMTLDFDGQQFDGRLSILVGNDGTLVDSWIGIARLGSAGLSGTFRCRGADDCHLNATTSAGLATDSPNETLTLTGVQRALSGKLGVKGPGTMFSIKMEQSDH